MYCVEKQRRHILFHGASMAIVTGDFIIASELSAAIAAVFPEHSSIVPSGMQGSPFVVATHGRTFVLANIAYAAPSVAAHGGDTFDAGDDVIDASGLVPGMPLYPIADADIFTSVTSPADLLVQFADRLAFLISLGGRDFRQLGYFYRFFTPSNTWQGVSCIALFG
jgi:hypothetical protein